MNRHIPVIFMVVLFLVSSCASMRPVPLDRSFWQEKGKRIGVALAAVPDAEVVINAAGTPVVYGGSIILSPDAEYTEHPLRLHETWALRQASKEVKAQEFEAVQGLLVKGLAGRGFAAFKVQISTDAGALERFREDGGEGVYACRDYRGVGRDVGAEYLIIVRMEHYGTMCRYIDLNNYEVEIYAQVRAQMIETASNRVLWRTGWSEGRFERIVNADCSLPDQVPIILDGLRTLLGDAATGVSVLFFSSDPVPED